MSLRIYGNRRLKTLPGEATRPTMGRVREALFSIWQDRIAGCRWLDLCCGYGTMGAEALARGAGWVVGVEQSALVRSVAVENWQQIVPDQSAVYVGVLPGRLNLLARKEPSFDLVYFDPPYDSGLYGPVLQHLRDTRLVHETSLVACEHRKGQLIKPVAGWICYDQRAYGTTTLSFFQLGTF